MHGRNTKMYECVTFDLPAHSDFLHKKRTQMHRRLVDFDEWTILFSVKHSRVRYSRITTRRSRQDPRLQGFGALVTSGLVISSKESPGKRYTQQARRYLWWLVKSETGLLNAIWQDRKEIRRRNNGFYVLSEAQESFWTEEPGTSGSTVALKRDKCSKINKMQAFCMHCAL